ncbi:formyltransferase family protein [Schnuerera ultunensis]|uniref:formyltransferase family protein n=1 Tax=Schnuerera ultunensis TaxID=45497 RepID=UPI0003F95912|nr:formyltransferase family protein [Schnuerera ultunensis]
MERKIAFIGTGGMFTKIVLEELLKNDISIELVIINIKKDSKEIPLSLQLCEKYCIKYFITDNINSITVTNNLNEHGIDLACVGSLHQIIKVEIFSIPEDGMINLHPSYLPYYQGPNPWFWMIKNNEDIFGASIHFIAEDIDKGELIIRERINLKHIVDGNLIFLKVSMLGAKLLVKVLKEYKTTGVMMESNVPEYELEKGFYNKKPTIYDYRLNLKDERPSINYKFINRVVRWGIPWFLKEDKIITVIKAVEFYENLRYDYKVLFKNKFIEVYNRYGKLVLLGKGH